MQRKITTFGEAEFAFHPIIPQTSQSPQAVQPISSSDEIAPCPSLTSVIEAVEGFQRLSDPILRQAAIEFYSYQSGVSRRHLDAIATYLEIKLGVE